MHGAKPGGNIQTNQPCQVDTLEAKNAHLHSLAGKELENKRAEQSQQQDSRTNLTHQPPEGEKRRIGGKRLVMLQQVVQCPAQAPGVVNGRHGKIPKSVTQVASLTW